MSLRPFALSLAIVLAGCFGPSPAPTVTLRVGVFQTQDFLPYFKESIFAHRLYDQTRLEEVLAETGQTR